MRTTFEVSPSRERQLAAAAFTLKRVTGIGGIFFEPNDVPALHAWYRRHLGIDVQEWGGTAFTLAEQVEMWHFAR